MQGYSFRKHWKCQKFSGRLNDVCSCPKKQVKFWWLSDSMVSWHFIILQGRTRFIYLFFTTWLLIAIFYKMPHWLHEHCLKFSWSEAKKFKLGPTIEISWDNSNAFVRRSVECLLSCIKLGSLTNHTLVCASLRYQNLVTLKSPQFY